MKNLKNVWMTQGILVAWDRFRRMKEAGWLCDGIKTEELTTVQANEIITEFAQSVGAVEYTDCFSAEG